MIKTTVNKTGMQKELLTIEFRYHDRPNPAGFGEWPDKTITIGVFDTLEEAVEEGNKTIKVLSKYFEVRPDDKFKMKFLFGAPKRLVTNTCYPTNGVQYFANITTLKFDNLEDTIAETFAAFERYKEYKREQKND